MPPSQKPRRPYKGDKSARDLAQMKSVSETDDARHAEEAFQHRLAHKPGAPMGPAARKPVGPAQPIVTEDSVLAARKAAVQRLKQIEVPTPKPLDLPPMSLGDDWKTPPRRLGGRRGMLIAAGAGTAAAGGAAYAVHRRRKKAAVTKLYNPFTDETVEVGKSFSPDQLRSIEGGIRRVAKPFQNAGGKAKELLSSSPNAALAGAGLGAAGTLAMTRPRRNDNSFGKAAAQAQLTSTSVTSVAPRPQRSGPTVSHGNDLKVVGRRKYGKPVMVEVHHANSHPAGRAVAKALSNQQGAALRGDRGTPMSGIMRAGRVGHRLTTS